MLNFLLELLMVISNRVLNNLLLKIYHVLINVRPHDSVVPHSHLVQGAFLCFKLNSHEGKDHVSVPIEGRSQVDLKIELEPGSMFSLQVSVFRGAKGVRK